MRILEGVQEIRDVFVQVLSEEGLLHDGEPRHYTLQGFKGCLEHLIRKRWEEKYGGGKEEGGGGRGRWRREGRERERREGRERGRREGREEGWREEGVEGGGGGGRREVVGKEEQ